MKKHILHLIICIAILCLGSFSSCKTESLVPQQEAVKDINGSWKIVQATRNGLDITGLFDFSQFRLVFNEGKYTLQNRLPFLVTQDGAYALDDPRYPFQVTFTTADGKVTPTTFTYPVVGGVRQINISFNPGCPENVYVYALQKSN